MIKCICVRGDCFKCRANPVSGLIESLKLHKVCFVIIRRSSWASQETEKKCQTLSEPPACLAHTSLNMNLLVKRVHVQSFRERCEGDCGRVLRPTGLKGTSAGVCRGRAGIFPPQTQWAGLQVGLKPKSLPRPAHFPSDWAPWGQILFSSTKHHY